MTAKRFHLGIDVRGALRNRAFDGFRHDDGRPMSRARAEAELKLLRAQGVKLIPCGPCDLFDPETGCPGHPMEEEPAP